MLLNLMHLMEVTALSEFLTSSSSSAPHSALSDSCMSTRAFIHVNSNDTLVLSEHLVMQRSCELRSYSE